jgi:hypothetical protein
VQDGGGHPTINPEEPMNALWIIAVFDLIDELMQALKHKSHVLAQVPDAEILTVAVVSAKFFQNHHERAFGLLQATATCPEP